MSTPASREKELRQADIVHPAPAAATPVGDDSFEGRDVDDATFLAVLVETLEAMDSAGVRYLLIGGIASSLLGRPRWTHDIDLFVFPHDAAAALEALGRAGFRTQETDPHWLFKAIKGGVLVDILFQSTGGIYLDEEMVARATIADFHGVEVRMASREDLVVMKAAAHTEQAARYWHDAVALVAHPGIDWEYFVYRARHAARRVLSLLIYAQSNDLAVPDAVIRDLVDQVYGPATK